MTKLLNMMEDYYGGYDPRTDFREDYKIAEGDTSYDEDIARKLQLEENNPNISRIDETKILPAAPTPNEVALYNAYQARRDAYVDAKRQDAEAKQRDAEAKRQDAEAKRQDAEAKRQDAEAKRQYAEAKQRDAEVKRQEFEVMQRDAEAKLQFERTQSQINRLEDSRRLEAERQALRKYYSEPYDRLINWSLSLMPDYYTYLKKKELRDAINNLVLNHIKHNTESQIEDMIRKLLREAEYAYSANTTPLTPTTRTESNRAARPKSNRAARPKSKKTKKAPSSKSKRTTRNKSKRTTRNKSKK